MEKNKMSPISDPAKAYDFAIYRRYYELGQTMSRNNFFMVFQGVIIAAFLNFMTGDHLDLWVWFLVSFMGLILSLLQFLMAVSGRKEIINTTVIAEARELDLLSQAHDGECVYHFFTRSREDLNKDYKVSNSTVDYRSVRPDWKRAGLCRDPKKNNASLGDECNFIAKATLEAPGPGLITVWVAIAFCYFWLAMLIRFFFNCL